MSLLEIAIRENAPEIVATQPVGKKTLYLKNQSLENRKVHVITSADSHIELPIHAKVAPLNNPDVSLATQGYYRELETCLAPHVVDSDFDIILLNNTLLAEFNRAGIDVRMETMSRQLIPTTTGKKFSAYFDYFEPEYVAYQTLLVQFNAAKLADGLAKNDSDLIIAKIDNIVTNDTSEYSIAQVKALSVKVGNHYYLPINVPNRNLTKTINIAVDYDGIGVEYLNKSKTLEVVTTRNDVAPFTVIRVASFARSFTSSRSLNVSTLSSKIYNSRRYVQVTHTVGDEATEIVIGNSNKSGNVTSKYVTALFGTVRDSSYVVELANINDEYGSNRTTHTELKDTQQRRLIRARNAIVTVQYNLGLTAVETFGIIAYKPEIELGLQATHNESLGLLTLASTHAVGREANGPGSFAISKVGLGIGDAIALNNYCLIAPVANAFYYWANNNQYEGGPSAWYGDEAIQIVSNKVVRQNNSTIIDTTPIGYVAGVQYVIERAETLLRIHHFYKYANSDIEGYLGYTEIPLLPSMAIADKLFVYCPYIYMGGSYGLDELPAEMSRVYPAESEYGSLPYPDNVGDSINVTVPVDVILTDVQIV